MRGRLGNPAHVGSGRNGHRCQFVTFRRDDDQNGVSATLVQGVNNSPQ
jgi:hypothetical protein